MTYLSEVFLSSLDDTFTSTSLASAIDNCNSEYLSRKDSVTTTELRDFWDVFKDFHKEVDLNSLPLLSDTYKTACDTGLIK